MFAIELANRLGFVHVDEMLQEMSPEEFDERYAAETIEPLGRRNTVILQAEMIAAVKIIARLLTSGDVGDTEITPDDLMPRFKSEMKTVKKRTKKKNLQEGFNQVKRMLGF